MSPWGIIDAAVREARLVSVSIRFSELLGVPQMGDAREYRVVWRREHDKRKRTRLYQTAEGALDFARFISRETWEEIDNLEDWAIENLRKLGDPIDVTVESRIVGAWEEGWPEHD